VHSVLLSIEALSIASMLAAAQLMKSEGGYEAFACRISHGTLFDGHCPCAQAVLEQTALAAARAKQREGDRLGEGAGPVDEAQLSSAQRRRGSEASIHSADRCDDAIMAPW
jgi:hypothetical protein